MGKNAADTVAGEYPLTVELTRGSQQEADAAYSNDSLAGANVEIDSALTLSLNRTSISEAGGVEAATGTVVRSGSTEISVTVALSMDLTGVLLPATVEIAAGQSGANFAIGVANNQVVDGSRTFTLNAEAAGFAPGSATGRIVDDDVPTLILSSSATIQITDRELPDLQVTAVTLPATALTGSTVTVHWTVINAGLGVTTGAWTDSLIISVDNSLSGDDVEVETFAGTPLGVGESYSRSASVELGTYVGPLWAFVITDRSSTMQELVEGNNYQGSSSTLNLQPAYRATVSTDFVQGLSGSKIQLAGHADDVVTGLRRAFVPVTIQVVSGNTVRNIMTVTDTTFSGSFTLSGAGAHRLKARAVDAAGNTADSFFDVFVDITALGVASLTVVSPNTRTTPLDTLDVNLDEAVAPGSFTYVDLALTRNGSSVALTPTVSVSLVSGNTDRIAGL